MRNEQPNTDPQPVGSYRLDASLHQSLTQPALTQINIRSDLGSKLPDPVYPRFPEKRGDVKPDERYLPRNRSSYPRRASLPMISRAMKGWLVPYLRSRLLPGDFHPIIAYLFTEFKCNLACQYCWAFDNRVKGMTEDTARCSIDWLHDTGCRVLALMGGEVLLRPWFAHKVVYYAAKKDFWVYVPTNGRLMRPDVIDRLGDAGVATINLAVDSVEDRKELPKALAPIRPYFDYLLKKQYVYGYSVFFNINITRINLDDVKQLTEIAHDAGIATDYHLNESPMMAHEQFKFAENNSTFITPDDWLKVDETINWLIEKNRAGYKMVNSMQRLEQMKAFMRGGLQEWNCRAGQNSLIIRTDGSLAPCFPFYSATCDWGVIDAPHFDTDQLRSLKCECQKHCFSTLNHTLAHCYDAGRVLRWLMKQAAHGFQGVTGSFDD
jgi:MoaA/NifB/PqqE/SkfB family radical SAM enzyme